MTWDNRFACITCAALLCTAAARADVAPTSIAVAPASVVAASPVVVAAPVPVATTVAAPAPTAPVVIVETASAPDTPPIAERGAFDMARWESVLDTVRTRAAAEKISKKTIDAALKNPAFIPNIVKRDQNQSEFKLTLDGYLNRTVNPTRIASGRKMANKYPTLLNRVHARYGVQPHVILAFWGMESNYGARMADHPLRDAFVTLIYEGRRQTFFTNQLIALMKIADKNGDDISDYGGSWAGAMGHFQFIPTTLAAYGVDGNGDGKIDISGSIGDAMMSAGNYLNRLGWNENERIVRRVVLPADFDVSLLDGKTKKTLSDWAALGATLPDGRALPTTDMSAGMVADTVAINDARMNAAIAPTDPNAVDMDVAPMPAITAYLTYPNFYRIKKWNNSNWYAIAIAELADALHQ